MPNPSNSNLAPDAEFLESPMLCASGFRHAFFTRSGGVSAGPYRSLNFSVAVGDTEDNVRQNLERAAARARGRAGAHPLLSQVHGSVVHCCPATSRAAQVFERQGDALVSGAAELACGVRTADCVPVLIADRRSGARGRGSRRLARDRRRGRARRDRKLARRGACFGAS